MQAQIASQQAFAEEEEKIKNISQSGPITGPVNTRPPVRIASGQPRAAIFASISLTSPANSHADSATPVTSDIR
jgi:hypothetical protein